MSEDDSRWQLDRRIPLALILAIVAQSFVAGGAIATLYGRVSSLEEKMAATAPLITQVARLETKFDAMKEDVGEIKSLVRAGMTRR